MRLGRVLDRWRRAEGWSQTLLAKEIGVSKATMGRIERGRNMDGETLMKVLRWITGENDLH